MKYTLRTRTVLLTDADETKHHVQQCEGRKGHSAVAQVHKDSLMFIAYHQCTYKKQQHRIELLQNDDRSLRERPVLVALDVGWQSDASESIPFVTRCSMKDGST